MPNSIVLTQQDFADRFAEAQAIYEQFHANVMSILREVNGEANFARIKESFEESSNLHQRVNQLAAGLSIAMGKRTKEIALNDWTLRQTLDNANMIALREMNSRTMNYLLGVYSPVLRAAQFIKEKRTGDPYAW